MKCDNCVNDAVYYVNDPGVNPVPYCALCLPHWLQERAAANHFPLPEVKAEKSKKTSSSNEDK
jgi:hypothetical protein